MIGRSFGEPSTTSTTLDTARARDTQMSMKIVVPDDFPVVLSGTPAERLLRTLGDVTVYTERGAEQDAELVRRIGAADIVVNIRAYSRFSESALTACPSVRMISIWG